MVGLLLVDQGVSFEHFHNFLIALILKRVTNEQIVGQRNNVQLYCDDDISHYVCMKVDTQRVSQKSLLAIYKKKSIRKSVVETHSISGMIYRHSRCFVK